MGVIVRNMLEQLGVRVIEVDGMCHSAVYVPEVAVLLVTPEVDDETLAEAADVALLAAPRPRTPRRDPRR